MAIGRIVRGLALLALVLTSLAALAACSSEDPTATPTATSRLRPPERRLLRANGHRHP